MLVSTLVRVAIALQLFSVASAQKFVLHPVPRDDVSAYQVRLAYHGVGGMTVSWNTYSLVSQPTVNYGLSADSLTSQASSEVSITYPTSTTWNNHVSIDGLKSDTTYYYQIENDSKVYSFTTAKAPGSTGEYTFAVAIDLGTMGPLGLSETSADPLAPGEVNTITSLTNAANEFDFLWQPGDIAYADAWLKEENKGYLGIPVNITSGYLIYDQILNAFYDEMAPISSVKPYMVGVGNHEADCDNGGYKKWTNSICVPGQTNFTGYKNHWKMPGDVSGGVGSFWYSFDHGLVHFVQFDTETDYPNAPESAAPNGNVGSYETEQLDWLANDLKNVDRTKTPWVIAAGHRPWYVSGGGSTDAQNAFESILNQYNVDIVFTGHEHNYQRMNPTATGGVIDPNGLVNPSAPWYILNGIAGHYKGKDDLHYPLPNYVAFAQDSAYGWSRVTVHNCTHITHEFVVSGNQSVIDTATLYKKRDGEAPCQISSSVSSLSSTASSVASSVTSSAASSVASSVVSSASSVVSSASLVAPSVVSSASSVVSSASLVAPSVVSSASSVVSSASSVVSSASLVAPSVVSSAFSVAPSVVISASSVASSVVSSASFLVASSAASSASSIVSSPVTTGSSIVSSAVTAAPNSTVTYTHDQTTVITITSCSDNACSKSSVTATWGPTTVTVNEVATVYTTWCPITPSESSTTKGAAPYSSKIAVASSSASSVTKSSSVTANTAAPVPSAAPVSSASVAALSSTVAQFTSKSPAVTTANSANKLSIQNAFVAGLALLAL